MIGLPGLLNKSGFSSTEGFDKAGFLVSQTDGDGKVTTFVNDAQGRVLHQETRNASGTLVSQQDNTYDQDATCSPRRMATAW